MATCASSTDLGIAPSSVFALTRYDGCDVATTMETSLINEALRHSAPFEAAWTTIDQLQIRYARGGRGTEKLVLLSPWPESIFAYSQIWSGLVARFEVVAIDLPGFGRSEGRDDLFSPKNMGAFIGRALDAFELGPVHGVGLDVGSPSILFAASARPELFRSLIVGAGASTFPLVVEGPLKATIEAPTLPALDSKERITGFLSRIRGYEVPDFVRDDYLASYAGDRMTKSAGLVRAYPKDLAALAPLLPAIQLPVAIVVGRNDPYGLANDATRLRGQLPHARLDVLEAGHCFWEERAPVFESIVAQWVSGAYRNYLSGA